MNTHTRINEHMAEAKKLFPLAQVLGTFCCGSQNYELDHEGSDVDSKCIILPSFVDICKNDKPISYVHELENKEHIEIKDVRLYEQMFKKQNINFVEILFTDYFTTTSMYYLDWSKLRANRELIARYCPYDAVQAMRGIATRAYEHLNKPGEGHKADIEKYGYSPKFLGTLLRVKEFIDGYTAEEPYSYCLVPRAEVKELILDIKTKPISYILQARELADSAMTSVEATAEKFLSQTKRAVNADAANILAEFTQSVMKKSLMYQLEGKVI